MVRQYLLLLIMFFDWLGKQHKMGYKAFSEFRISKTLALHRLPLQHPQVLK